MLVADEADRSQSRWLLGCCTHGCCLREQNRHDLHALNYLATTDNESLKSKIQVTEIKRTHQLSLSETHTHKLTCGKPSSKEDVEEFLRGDVGLKVAVEVAVVSVASVGGALRRSLFSILVILMTLLSVAEHRIRIAYGCKEKNTYQAYDLVQSDVQSHNNMRREGQV